MKNTCISCVHYDGELCTKDLNNLDYGLVNETMYKEPFDTCEDHEDYFDREGEDDE